MRAVADSRDMDLLARSKAARFGWLVLGFVMLGIACIGVVVPLLPAIDFLLLALACFARSSPRMEAWLLNHRYFGPYLRAWRNHRAVAKVSKISAVCGMSLGFAFFYWGAQPSWPWALLVAALLIGCAAWVVSRPTATKEMMR